jgi:hypothetical protein
MEFEDIGTLLEDALTESDFFKDPASIRKYFDDKLSGGNAFKYEINVENGKIELNIDGKTTIDISDIQDSINKGNISEVYKKLSGDKPIPKDIQENITKLEQEWTFTPAGRDIQLAEEVKSAGDDVAENAKKAGTDLTKIKNIDELKSKLTDDGQKQLVQLQKNLEEFKQTLSEQGIGNIDDLTKILDENGGTDDAIKNDPKLKDTVNKIESSWSDNVKKFLKLAVVLALILIAADIIDFFVLAAHAKSGCFSRRGTNGEQCKIKQLTCSRIDTATGKEDFLKIIGNTSKFLVCNTCTTNPDDPQCVNDSQSWIPVVTANFCQCSGAPTNYLSGYKQDIDINANSNTTGQNSCQTSCGMTAPNISSDVIVSACPNIAGCVARNEACNGQNAINDDCSVWCDSKKIKTFSDQTISCEQYTWVQAAAAIVPGIFNKVLSFAENLLSPLKKILLIIALVIVGLIAFFIIGRILLSLWHTREEQKLELIEK